MKSRRQCDGFTLIQVSILLVVASLTLVALLPSSTSRLDKDNASTKTLNAALFTLRQYQAANGALPCPADASQPVGASNYGVAAANSGASGNCAGGTPAANYSDAANHVAVGMLPVRALGLPNTAALDAYGRHITYAVDTNATACWASSALAGQITVTDNGTANSTAVVLISHGADGHGASIPRTGSTGAAVRLNAGSTDADQLTNAHVDASFAPTATLSNFIKKSPTATFDDLVVYKNPLWNFATIPVNTPYPVMTVYPPNGTSQAGQTWGFTITFSSVVTVTGTPELSLSALVPGSGNSIGTGNVAYATYQSGSGTNSLSFSYTIAGGDTDANGISVSAPIVLNGGTVSNSNLCFMPPDLSQVFIGSIMQFWPQWFMR